MDPAPVSRPPRKKCLAIGINYDRADLDDWEPLRGPRQDAEALSDLLIKKFGYAPKDVTLMRDIRKDDPAYQEHLHPTRDNILEQIDRFVEGARTGDKLVFHYSGHSGQVHDENDDEEDGLDEYILTVDGYKIIDDALKEQLVDRLPIGVRLVAIIDGCHSGSMLDLPHSRCNPIDVLVSWEDCHLIYGAKTRKGIKHGSCPDLRALLKNDRHSEYQVSTSTSNAAQTLQSARSFRRKRLARAHHFWDATLKMITAQAHLHDVVSDHHLHMGTKAEQKMKAPEAVMELVANARANGIGLATPTPSGANELAISVAKSLLRLDMEYVSQVAPESTPHTAISTSEEGEDEDENNWRKFRFSVAPPEVPAAHRIVCDGNCRIKCDPSATSKLAQVISLSAAKDEQVALEGPDGRSMTMILIEEIGNNPQVSIQNVMTNVHLKLRAQWENGFITLRNRFSQRKYSKALDAAETLQKLFAHFQDPVVSSHAPLDLNAPLDL